MKQLRALLLLLTALMLAFTLVGCGIDLDALTGLLGGNTTGGESEGGESTGNGENDGTNNEENDNTDNEENNEYNVITIAEALELCGEPGNITTERYYIRGIVRSISNASYGAMTVEDETGSISVYGTYSADGSLTFTQMESTPKKGDEVLLHCILQNYNGTKEVKNARLIEFKENELVIDTSAYTEMTVSEARDAAEDAKVKVDGVVARITYASGMKPSGFYLVDETESIYVYGTEAANAVKLGNKVTVIGTKDYWILEKEMNNAKKFGYKGCNQLADAEVIENDNKTDNEFNKTWIRESTVKEMMETPVENDITTTIFKVNALVTKAPGSGFTNYYFNDLDGTTGSYTYTQCDGDDFGWLDEFDGKICTVYLSVINAKSTTSSCLYRFIPILVIDEEYVFDTDGAAEHAVKYYGVDQFLSVYSGDPALELITSVSSELLGFENATLSYSSSNTDSVTITEADGKVVMNCIAPGKSTVTITGSYNSIEYSKEVEITVSEAINYDYVAVKDAIAASVDETVIVKGIVGPSLVNKSGFYLIDETGVIAVIIDAASFELIEIGQEIILQGVRENYRDDNGDTSYYGQTCLVDGEILANNYGSHEYDDSTFITGKTLADFYALDATVDYTTSVFVLTATVTITGNDFYSGIALKSGNTTVTIYCSSANQYSWLKAYAGQEVTLEVAACNWNNKNYYRGCVLSVITEDGKILNTLNFN